MEINLGTADVINCKVCRLIFSLGGLHPLDYLVYLLVFSISTKVEWSNYNINEDENLPG